MQKTGELFWRSLNTQDMNYSRMCSFQLFHHLVYFFIIKLIPPCRAMWINSYFEDDLLVRSINFPTARYLIKNCEFITSWLFSEETPL